MGTGQMTAQEIFDVYKEDMLKLIAYLPWLEKTSGKSIVSKMYDNMEPGDRFMAFPVYDGTLLSFIKEAESTRFIDRNYVYTITRNRLNSTDKEKDFAKSCDIFRLDDIGGILSKYILEGRVKAFMWSVAVDEGIFLEIVKRLQEIYSECLQWE